MLANSISKTNDKNMNTQIHLADFGTDTSSHGRNPESNVRVAGEDVASTIFDTLPGLQKIKALSQSPILVEANPDLTDELWLLAHSVQTQLQSALDTIEASAAQIALQTSKEELAA
jgi:hypothetical protein